MAYITYKMLLGFLTEKAGLSQTVIAKALNISKSSISRVLSGKMRQIAKGISCDGFYKAFEEFVDKNDTVRLYDYLVKNDAVDEDIKDAYSKTQAEIHENKTTAQETFSTFIKLLVERAEGSRSANLNDEEEAPAETVGFAPFKYHMSENFVGREDLVEEIASTLGQYGMAIVCGFGGLGKSQSALYYVEQSKKNSAEQQAQMVFFHDNLKATLLDIPFCGLKEYQNNRKEAIDEQVRRRLDVLREFSSDAILIIDNMDVMEGSLSPEDQEILEKLRKMELNILITSRNMKLYAEQYRIRITPLSKEDQLELFLRNYMPKKEIRGELSEDKISEYKKILQRVYGHTMLIELIAKIMREYSFSPKKMLKILAEGRGAENLFIYVEKDDSYKQEDIYQTISTLFNISNIDEASKQVLLNLVLTSINGVRMAFFADFLLEGGSIGRISNLIHHSWIIRDSQMASEDDRIHLHPLIKTVLLKNMSPSLEKCTAYIVAAIQAYMRDDEDITPMDRRDVCTILINAGEMFKDEYDASSVGLLLRQAEIIHKDSRYDEAWKQCKRVMELCESEAECAAEIRPAAYRLQADIAVNLARYRIAIESYKAAIGMWEKQATPPYEDIAKAYNRLANVYRKDSRYTSALDNFRLAENRMDVNGIDNPSLKADIFNNIGIVYINLDDLDKAMEYYKKACRIREEANPQDKRQLAYSYHNIGTVYQRKRMFEEAVEYHTKALDLRREVYRKDDPTIAESLTMLGNDYAEAAKDNAPEKYKIAMGYIDDGRKIRENSLGPDHPAMAWSYESLGKIFFYQESFEEAQACFRKCLRIREARLGMAHAYTAQALFWLGKIDKALERYDEAMECLEKALDIQGKVKPSAQKKTKALLEEIWHLRKRGGLDQRPAAEDAAVPQA